MPQSVYAVILPPFTLTKIEIQTFSMDWPVRTISFSHDGQLLASASEDMLIDIGEALELSGTGILSVVSRLCGNGG